MKEVNELEARKTTEKNELKLIEKINKLTNFQ